MSIKESLKILNSVREHEKVVDGFAYEQYLKRLEGNPVQAGTWRGYKGYEVRSATELVVKFASGAGDMEFENSFVVSL